MAAVKKLEAVPTLADKLRDAIRERDARSVKLAEIAQRQADLQEIENREAAARAALDTLAQKDADDLATWARAGAKGDAPRANESARKSAGEELARCQREADAARKVIHELESDYAECAGRMGDAATAVAGIAADILAHEVWQKYDRYRSLVAESIELEHGLTLARTRLLQLGLPNAAKHGEEIGDRFIRDHFSQEEVAQHKSLAMEAEAARWQALLRGEV